MAKAIYNGVNGVARKVKQPYVGVDGVARKVTGGYVGVDGVARECFSSSVTWKKYSCNLSGTWVRQVYSSMMDGSERYLAPGYGAYLTIGYYTGYTFSESKGFKGSGNPTENGPATSASVTLEECQRYLTGLYTVFSSDTSSYKWQLGEITRIEHKASGTGMYIYYIPDDAEYAYLTDISYSKGSTSYGEIEALDGELPETGTLVDGSLTDSYCVLKKSSTTYYYYERV